MAETLEAILYLLSGEFNPFMWILVFSDKNGPWLEAIQFIQVPLVRDIAHEVVDIRLFLLLTLIFLEDERLGPTETIVQLSDLLGVAQRQSALLRGEFPRELVELLKTALNRDGSVEEDRENGLGGACVVDDLACKEQILIVVL